MKTATKTLMLIAVLAFAAAPTMANPVNVYSQDGPQDPLVIEGPVHELGDGFPANELIESSNRPTDETACDDPGSEPDDPAIPNVLVTMTNLTRVDWHDVHYVADPETGITNFDGWIGNMGATDAQFAFRIDNIGINRPLVSESIIVDNIFQANETWEFIIQDFVNQMGGPPTPFDSLGIAGRSGGWPPSTGSIIAVPEPATMSLLVLGGIGMLVRRRRK